MLTEKHSMALKMMSLKMLKVVALLALLNCCVFKVASRQNIDNIHSDNWNALSPKQSSEEREMLRRAINSKERTSCGSRDQCTGNQTVLETTSTYYNCYCDNACYETFQDCCPDFVKTCGDQKETVRKTLKNLWQCVDLHLSKLGGYHCTLHGPEGVWMIHNCPTSWPLDETSSKCQNVTEKFSYPLEDFLPVVGSNKLTYRNKHCAICNGELQYTTWDVIVEAFLTPPSDYSLDDKMRFLLANGGSVKNIKPHSDMPRRYCAGKKYKDTCLNMAHPDYNSCVKGPVETVWELSGRYYKNKACAYCNGESEGIIGTRSIQACHALPKELSCVFSLGCRDSSSNTRVVKYCPTGFGVVQSTEDETSLALRILTLISFSISVFFLLLLLVTYGIFKELRSLPGLNLMSLSVSMLLSHIIWLIGTAHFQDAKVCEVLGVLEHYLFLVSFMAMSVISYHSCVVFSRSFGTSSNSTRRFVKYSTLVWLTPALFVAVCVILDQTDTTFDIYGDKCWLETNKAVLYLFLLPVAVLLVCNIYTFIKTALALSRSKKDTRILQQNRKQNLLICAKLATLVGFPWIFAFFGVIFPDVEAFEYLFVIFVCLQGFYIGIAFVLNKKTRQLYKKWWKNTNTTKGGSTQPKPTFQMSQARTNPLTVDGNN